MNRIAPVIFLIIIQYTYTQNALGQNVITPGKSDTIRRLTNNHIKYWDRVDTSNTYHISDNINWCFKKKNCSILEYYYDKNNKRCEYVYGEDVVLGETPFLIIADTIVLPNIKMSFLIKRLNDDTLILNQLISDGISKDIIYIKSKDQRQEPIPFFKPWVSKEKRLKRKRTKNLK